ncbi:DUF3068 domain-containing protein [Corynebacterium uberis]|uniref:DUF3068 domain-containing protein n=1 Tax=Corynebacterium TaxID=1716 RepID=UPI001D0BA2C0|nr:MULTISPECIES: DUF3068 domain-containing protein [Corynebacterium]MCZ9309451.1 DUF3068 domain-containing protein [Corynebacterium sp. c6VSa_13]UDL73000.1 DUF3068 domain-containing protein [Corynebacterium uberis]UDL76123.1 DUF3068 domain-containing protein [Corynebacterium uberis]UDL78335.1 DUF3068 domain-containing protein [Corynebacterium uberis]UDL80618.1 DUF3068 domain-containing protein [Corynebacterium uberis]
MLPRSRVVSVLLLGLGAALLAAGLLAPRFIPGDGRLALDVGELTWTTHDEAATTRVFTDPQRRVFQAPVTHQLNLTIEEPTTASTATARVGSTFVRTSLQQEHDRLMQATVWNWVLDRVTGAAVGPMTLSYQMASPTAQLDVDGVWLKFPANLGRDDVSVLDETLRRATPATFIDETELHGRKVYHFRQDIAPTNVALDYEAIGTTIDLPTPEGHEGPGETGYLFHSAVRDYYVDQASGLVLNIEESIDDYYGTLDGTRREPVLAFHGVMEDSQTAQLAQVAQAITQHRGVGMWSWITAGIGAVLAALGLLGALGVASARRANRATGRAARADAEGAGAQGAGAAGVGGAGAAGFGPGAAVAADPEATGIIASRKVPRPRQYIPQQGPRQQSPRSGGAEGSGRPVDPGRPVDSGRSAGSGRPTGSGRPGGRRR